MAIMASDQLALPLNAPIAKQPPKDRLPFALTRKLGELGSTSTTPPTPPRPKDNLVAGCIGVSVQAVQSVSLCRSLLGRPKKVADDYPFWLSPTLAVGRCLGVSVANFLHLSNCQKTSISTPVLLANCQGISPKATKHLTDCTFVPTIKTVAYHGCVALFNARKVHYHTCQHPKITPAKAYQHELALTAKGKQRHSCQSTTTSVAVIVPCRYYPIVEPPTPPSVSVCQLRPPSDRLPLALRRKAYRRQNLSTDSLPLPLVCWHDIPPATTPNLRSYIVHNTITATLDGLNIDPLSFSIKTDMDSFCWQGQIELGESDFRRIKTKLDVARGHEPLITVTINGHAFSLLAEGISKNRSFVNHSYTLSGRSITARLSADYADIVKMDNELYASQIVNDALANLPITADFGVDDWLTYATLSGTPITVIDMVAKACGGFVVSDKADAKLYLKKRYKVPAWELATATPDRIVSLDVIKSISEQKHTNPRYNAVILTSSSDGAVVYREREGQDSHAPVSQNELYTDQACIISAGIAILSDSGTHQTASITLKWADKYNLLLASLGEIWQVNDKVGNNDDAWRGIVKAVAVSVNVDNGVPVVWQSVELDRYLDV